MGWPVKVYPDDGEPFEPEIGTGTSYANEIVEFVKCIREDRISEINPPESSMQTIEIFLKERSGREKYDYKSLK